MSTEALLYSELERTVATGRFRSSFEHVTSPNPKSQRTETAFGFLNFSNARTNRPSSNKLSLDQPWRRVPARSIITCFWSRCNGLGSTAPLQGLSDAKRAVDGPPRSEHETRERRSAGGHGAVRIGQKHLAAHSGHPRSTFLRNRSSEW